MSNVYISKALRKDIPSEAILLTREDAVGMHWDMIKDWKPKSDTWPFRYGIGILSGITSMTAFTMANFYRTRLHLGNYGRVTMVLPSVILPTAASIFTHLTVVTSSIFLGEDCPLCIQTKAAAIQVGLGVVFPSILTPIGALYYSMVYSTYDVPPLRLQNIPEIIRIIGHFTAKMGRRIPIAVAANGIGAAVLTYFEANSFYHLQSVIYEKEQNFIRLIEQQENSK